MKPQILLQADLIRETHQLGQSMATYRGEMRLTQKLSFGCALLFGCIAMLSVASLAVFLILTVFAGHQNTPGAGVVLTITIILLLLSLALLVLFVGIWYRAIPITYVMLCPEGFVYIRRHKVQAVHWNEVETFWQAMGNPNAFDTFAALFWYIPRRKNPPIPPNTFRLRTTQGIDFQFRGTFLNLATSRSFTDIWERLHAEMELIKRMEREISIRLWEKAVAKYEAGLPATFGKVQVSAQEVRKGREVRRWEEIDSLALYDDEGLIREFKRPETWPDVYEEANSTLSAPDLDTHLAYWHEDVSAGAWIVLLARDEYMSDLERYMSEMPNTLVYVALIAYALYKQ